MKKLNKRRFVILAILVFIAIAAVGIRLRCFPSNLAYRLLRDDLFWPLYALEIIWIALLIGWTAWAYAKWKKWKDGGSDAGNQS